MEDGKLDLCNIDIIDDYYDERSERDCTNAMIKELHMVFQ